VKREDPKKFDDRLNAFTSLRGEFNLLKTLAASPIEIGKWKAKPRSMHVAILGVYHCLGCLIKLSSRVSLGLLPLKPRLLYKGADDKQAMDRTLA
jgi:hypothetical protein